MEFLILDHKLSVLFKNANSSQFPKRDTQWGINSAKDWIHQSIITRLILMLDFIELLKEKKRIDYDIEFFSMPTHRSPASVAS